MSLAYRFRSYRVWAALAVIVAVGAALRFYDLDGESFWLDELLMVREASAGGLWATIRISIPVSLEPPAYIILHYFVQNYFGASETALRFLPACFGVLSLVLIFFLGRRLYGDAEGLLAAALLAVLWAAVYYSQEARPYSQLVAMVLALALAWLRWVDELRLAGRATWRTLILYVVLAALTCYTHYFGLLFVLMQAVGLAVIARQRGASRQVVGAFVVIALTFAPWLPGMAYHLLRSQHGGWIQRPTLTALIDFLLYYLNRSAALLLCGMALIVLFAAPLLSRWYGQRGDARDDVITGMLLIWLFFPLVLAFLVSIVVKPILVNRYLIISLPALCLVLARAVVRLPLRSSFRGVLAVLLVAYMLYDLLFRLQYYSQPRKEQFREAAAAILQDETSGADSLVIGYSYGPDLLNYYFGRLGSDRTIDLLARSDQDIDAVRAAIRERQPGYVWLFRAHLMPSPEFMTALQEDLHLLKHQAFIGADVWLFERR